MPVFLFVFVCASFPFGLRGRGKGDMFVLVPGHSQSFVGFTNSSSMLVRCVCGGGVGGGAEGDEVVRWCDGAG